MLGWKSHGWELGFCSDIFLLHQMILTAIANNNDGSEKLPQD